MASAKLTHRGSTCCGVIARGSVAKLSKNASGVDFLLSKLLSRKVHLFFN